MVDLDSSGIVIRGFHIEQNHQYPDYKENTSHRFHYDFLSYDASNVNPHLFIVDWQIPESEEDIVKEDYLTL